MIYQSAFTAKNGSLIPIYSSGKPGCSKYNPEREAETQKQNLREADFFIFAGTGGGFLIQETAKAFPEARILAVEETEEDISFLKNNFPLIKKLSEQKNIIFAWEKTFSALLLENYLPAVHSNLEFYALPSWAQENPDAKNRIVSILQQTLDTIRKDFSVQAHFGKIWTKNILQNLTLCRQETEAEFPIEKKAVVCAAGPTLEKKITDLKKESSGNFVIATDTAYKILLRNNVKVDAVFSVDGQHVSINHFTKKTEQNPLFIFSLSGNHHIALKLSQANKKVIFTVSKNPLEQLVYCNGKDSFLPVDTASGTVTVAAADFARKAGFKNIEIYGADFSYPGGKAYAAGSYLDDIYQMNQKKNANIETSFSKLMYRTELFQNEEGNATTETLSFYRKELSKWAEKNGCTILKKDGVYRIKAPGKNEFSKGSLKPFNQKMLKDCIQEKAGRLTAEESGAEEFIYSLLPLISSMKLSDIKKGDVKKFDVYLKLALNFILRYTEKYE